MEPRGNPDANVSAVLMLYGAAMVLFLVALLLLSSMSWVGIGFLYASAFMAAMGHANSASIEAGQALDRPRTST